MNIVSIIINNMIASSLFFDNEAEMNKYIKAMTKKGYKLKIISSDF